MSSDSTTEHNDDPTEHSSSEKVCLKKQRGISDHPLAEYSDEIDFEESTSYTESLLQSAAKSVLMPDQKNRATSPLDSTLP